MTPASSMLSCKSAHCIARFTSPTEARTSAVPNRAEDKVLQPAVLLALVCGLYFLDKRLGRLEYETFMLQ